MRFHIILVLTFIFFLESHTGVTAHAEESPLSPRPQEAPTGTVTLRQAQALALTHNPELRAFSWEVRAQEAATLQAGLLPNPTLGADLQDFGGPTSSEGTLQLHQLIELGGKRTKRREVAVLSRDLAGWDYETKRIAVFTQVSQSFTDLLGAQQQLALTEETVRLAEEMARVVSERVRAGKVSPIDEIRANVALASAGIERDLAGAEWDAARKRLAATWGNTMPQSQKAEGTLGPVLPIPAFDTLTTRLSQNPELARWDTEIAKRQAAVDLAQLQAVPDLTLTGGVRRYESTRDNVFTLGLSLPLPIFNRNQGGIAEARTRLAKGKEERRAAAVRVATALSDAYRALSTAHIEATSLTEKVLPGATQAFEAVNEGYRLGKFGLLDVLDAQRTLFGSRAQYLRALTDYHRAMAAGQGLIGESMEKGERQTPPGLPLSVEERVPQ